MSVCLWLNPGWYHIILSLHDQSRSLVFSPCAILQKWRKISGLRAKDVGHVLLHWAKSEVPVKTYAVFLIQIHHFQIAPCISSLGSKRTIVLEENWGQARTKTELRQSFVNKTHSEAAREREMEEMLTEVSLWTYHSHEITVHHQKKSCVTLLTT